MVSVTFDNPFYLWFLLAVPFIVIAHFFMLRHAKRKAMKFANFVVIKRITGERLITKNYTLLILRVLVITCAIFAIAQTHVWYEGLSNENDYVITIDTSASMTTRDFDPDRLSAAKKYAEQFTDALDFQTKIAVVSFSGITFIEQPLTTAKSDVRDVLRALEPVAAGTDIPGAIITGTNVLHNSERGRAIILITDGSNTIEDFHSNSLQRAIAYAKVNRVKIYTIGVGKDIRVPIGYLPTYYNVSSTYNDQNLKYIAEQTNGKYYSAQNEEEMVAAYNDIGSNEQLSTLSFDLTGGLMVAALTFLLLEWWLANTKFRPLP
jgi:Ca-activated chloride channel family protein